MCEDEVLLEEEEGGGVILVDGDPLALVPVQVVVLHQHLQATRMDMSVKNVRFMKIKHNFNLIIWLRIIYMSRYFIQK